MAYFAFDAITSRATNAIASVPATIALPEAASIAPNNAVITSRCRDTPQRPRRPRLWGRTMPSSNTEPTSISRKRITPFATVRRVASLGKGPSCGAREDAADAKP